MHEDDAFEPCYVGVRQHNPDPQWPGDNYIDIKYGVFQNVCEGDNAWTSSGILFDTDEEYDEWDQEQYRLANEEPKHDDPG